MNSRLGTDDCATSGCDLLHLLLARQDLIEALARRPRSKPELVEASERSRSTVDRGIKVLDRVGIVSRNSKGEYDLTLFGTVVHRELERTLSHVETLAEIRTFIDDAATDGYLDPALFDESQISHTDGLGISTALDTFADATTVQLIDPPFGLVFLALGNRDWPQIGTDVSVVLRQDVIGEIASHNPTFLDSYLERGITLYEMELDLPFSFALIADGLQRSLCLILGNGQDGMVFIESTSPSAFEWGKALYKQTTANAQEIFPNTSTE